MNIMEASNKHVATTLNGICFWAIFNVYISINIHRRLLPHLRRNPFRPITEAKWVIIFLL
jgi:hypothetical protein